MNKRPSGIVAWPELNSLPEFRRHEKVLYEVHVNDRNHILTKIGHGSDEAIPYDERYLVSIVSPSEGNFCADYLEIPRANVIHVKKGKRLSEEKLESGISNILNELSRGSLTFLGHMTPDGFGGMEADRLARIVKRNNITPVWLNFFSCSSDTYSQDFVKTMASEEEDHRYQVKSHQIQHSTSVKDMEEISQWPKVSSKRRPHLFFYGGREIGPSCQLFCPTHHTGIQNYLVTRDYSSK